MSKNREQNKWMGIAWVAIAVALAGMMVLGVVAVLGQRGEPTSAVVQSFPTSSTRHVFQDGAITDTNGAVLDVRYYPALGIQVEGITAATVEFECTVDRSNWNDVQLVNVETGAVVTSTTSDGVFAGMVGGLEQIRCPISGYSSGTITVTGSATTGSGRELTDDVDILTIAAGETHIGEVGYSGDWITMTMTPAATTYADGDVLADTQEVASAMRINGGSGIVTSLVILDEDDQGGDLDVVFLRSNVSLGTEDSAVSISDADAQQIMCTVRVLSSDYDDLVASQVATLANIGCGIESAAASTSVWVSLISRDTKTYTTSGIQLAVFIDQN